MKEVDKDILIWENHIDNWILKRHFNVIDGRSTLDFCMGPAVSVMG